MSPLSKLLNIEYGMQKAFSKLASRLLIISQGDLINELMSNTIFPL